MVRLYQAILETGVYMETYGDDNGRIHIVLNKSCHKHTFDIGLMGASEETITNVVVETIYEFNRFVDRFFDLANA